MKTEHKITPDLQRRIAAAAKELPPMAQTNHDGSYKYKNEEVPGSKLKPEQLKPGTPLMPNAMYRVKVLQYENHAQNITALVKKDGPVAIENYVDGVQFQFDRFLHAAKQAKLNKNIFRRVGKAITKFITYLKSK